MPTRLFLTRATLTGTLLFLSACQQRDSTPDSGATETAGQPAAPVGAEATIDPAFRSRSPAAQEAKAAAAHYLSMLAEGDYAGARRVWDDEGAASGGDDAAFAAVFSGYSRYVGVAGDPTFISERDGRQYILVQATVSAQPEGQPDSQTLSGTIMLRRPVEPAADDRQGSDWRIWGTDLRLRR